MIENDFASSVIWSCRVELYSAMEGQGEDSSGELVNMEEFFPKNEQKIISSNIATNDAQTIQHKLEQYTELDSEER